ncbi:glycosyltransferase family 2 protein, partial [Campylobacter jejuni]|uniref:glycosyltransferase family 2 protein n=3 Tax=Campylobacteraceae TaxID=72294 RepID=UPI0006B42893
MENKTVGVVIPIYNVEKYLKECLDSVINQTYKNLQVILVNDGSTDENSFNIAKEYTLKDERFILFDKKNGGQGTARNVGIEYFSGEYILKNKTQILEINSLIEFNIEGNNPYEIYTVYKSYKAFHTTKDLSDFIYPSIDYIIFLDSDDYWELDCIEECVKRMNGVDLVCFDFTIFNEINDVLNWSGASSIRFFPYLSSDIIVDRLLILSKLNDYGFFLCCAWAMFIDFNFIKKNNIKFIDNVVREDNYFSFVLILNINNILITKKKLTNYRIRKGSDCNYDKSNLILSDIPERMKYLLKYFDDFDEMRQYYNIFSWIEIAKKTLTDIQKLEKNDFLFAYNLYKIFY